MAYPPISPPTGPMRRRRTVQLLGFTPDWITFLALYPRFAFIKAEKASLPVALMCRVLKVSRAGFYAWRSRPAAKRTRQDQVLATVRANYRSILDCPKNPTATVSKGDIQPKTLM